MPTWDKDKIVNFIDRSTVAVERAILAIDRNIGFEAIPDMARMALQIKLNKYGKPSGEKLNSKQYEAARINLKKYLAVLERIVNTKTEKS